METMGRAPKESEQASLHAAMDECAQNRAIQAGLILEKMGYMNQRLSLELATQPT